MSHIEKEKLIKADIASIENRVRHAFNQGYDLGYKEGKANRSEIPTGSTTKNDLEVDCISRQAVIDLMMQKWGENFSGDDAMQESIDAIRVMPSVTPQEPILDKIKAEITDCLKALDNIEKSGLNIYLPNEISGRRLTYQQCLEFIDKYKAESEDAE